MPSRMQSTHYDKVVIVAGVHCNVVAETESLVCAFPSPTCFKSVLRFSTMITQDTNQSNSSRRKICPFFIARKNRFCRMTVGDGMQYCGEHVTFDPHIKGDNQRIPCPYDSRHSCYAHSLKKHMEKCNARPTDNPVYISKNVNKGLLTDFSAPKLGQVDASYLTSLLERVRSVYNGLGGFVVAEHLEHSVLDESLAAPDLGCNAKKHLIQNSSLLGHVEKFDLRGKLGIIEFGAGKGQLTYWLARALPQRDECQFIIVDKGTLRHKSENKIKEPSLGNVNRYRVDIADLRLSQLPPACGVDRCIAVSKHLCGAATDLALRCVINGVEESDKLIVDGIVIAVCCHHRCDWNSYTGKDFLCENGFEASDFGVMCGIASWATCGTGQRKNAQSPEEELKGEVKCQMVEGERERRLDLTPEEREEYGKMVKLILDYGRKRYLESRGFICNLRYYVDPDVSPENVCLWAKLKS
ncbi:tRNA:m(4)X modification enzyme TRM13 homolog [Ischnura elegans]|uniref:tRNA:m(4)X modification enzyme TRM13 homolog n=1 Tax=Ischnura elegans TaxID=197161 RepID=UPI001ED881C9|nr:tRNA:m(4)X modification enzyme TRM13 homolog [Ischnura elegans]